ncbi:glycosyltransferase [Aestuariimicrobium sp. p3-SID1156]|uniref:glycosyltransferase family 2 protein n=1 Tax=Aestuariimicrobium sp. p3-SID1156 TaxID=2916038 RepID=UPI00223BBBB9|nr:glycosyltransferase [Aestuariimicrobium sp. p3-SID1156]MCT1458273.1 glycosyltransferase [Aestuariimicrobium sp. p3-SID1156]
MALASIVVPSRGGAARLPALLSALAAQDDPEWEAIVVIDGDIDDSASVVAKYSHLAVRSIVFPENRGRVAALNTGFAEARGDVLIRCDDDLVPQPDYVRQHKMSHAAEPGGSIGLCLNVLPDNAYARIYGREADRRFQSGAYETPSSELWRLWGGNVSTTRDLWSKVGPYDASYRTYGWEDVDWGYRLAREGVTIRLVRGAEVLHTGAAADVWSRVKRAFHSGAARRTFEEVHGSAILSPQAGRRGIWNQVVSFSAAHLDRGRLRAASATVQFFAPILPTYVGHKLVALLVESAAVSGYQRPHETRADF